jgi:hypothetical protein
VNNEGDIVTQSSGLSFNCDTCLLRPFSSQTPVLSLDILLVPAISTFLSSGTRLLLFGTENFTYTLLDMAAQQFQAAQKVIDDANWFLNYRDPAAPPYTPQTLDAFWRQNNYVEPSPPGPAAQFPGWPAARAQFPPPAVLNHQQQFLNKAVPELANLPSPALAVNWVGQKFLAEGGTGIVGMWQYNGPPTNVSMPRRVVVKELLPNRSAFDLQEETDHINALSQFSSDHIVALVQKNPIPTTGAAEGLGPEWDGVVRRMILEYSSLGDLDDLLDIRMGM